MAKLIYSLGLPLKPWNSFVDFFTDYEQHALCQIQGLFLLKGPWHKT